MTNAPVRGEPPVRDEPPVRVTRDGGLATVVLSRPAALNALDRATKVLLRDELADLAADPSVRAVLLTGTGRGFCVGQDLREHVADLAAGSQALSTTVVDHYNPIALSLATMPKPVVAAVNGVAAGAGGSLALAADLRVAARSASFTTAFAGVALSADTGASWWLARHIGVGRAMDLLLSSRVVPAEEALAIGLFTQVVDDDQLMATATELAQRLAQGPTVAYASIKQAVAYAATHPLPQALAREAELMALTGASQDHRAAVEAFLAKQPPTFHGK